MDLGPCSHYRHFSFKLSVPVHIMILYYYTMDRHNIGVYPYWHLS